MINNILLMKADFGKCQKDIGLNGAVSGHCCKVVED